MNDRREGRPASQIVCIGNRLVPGDAAGLLVYDVLQQRDLPENVTLVEGGLAGLNLLPLLEVGGRVVFVDAVAGFGEAGTVVVLTRERLLSETAVSGYGHAAGLPYLLTMLPHVCEGAMAEEIHLVGLEGVCDETAIAKAAELCVEIAEKGYNH